MARFLVSVFESPLTTVTNRTLGNSPRIRSTRSTCGSQSVPRVTTNVITRAPRSLGQTVTIPFPRTSQAGTFPAFLLQGAFWQMFASPPLSPAALGAAKAGSGRPTSGPLRPLPWLGSVSANRRTPRPMRNRMPTAQAYLFPGRGTSGRRAGSGCVRSRSASRSPTERSSKRSPFSPSVTGRPAGRGSA